MTSLGWGQSQGIWLKMTLATEEAKPIATQPTSIMTTFRGTSISIHQARALKRTQNVLLWDGRVPRPKARSRERKRMGLFEAGAGIAEIRRVCPGIPRGQLRWCQAVGKDPRHTFAAVRTEWSRRVFGIQCSRSASRHACLRGSRVEPLNHNSRWSWIIYMCHELEDFDDFFVFNCIG